MWLDLFAKSEDEMTLTVYGFDLGYKKVFTQTVFGLKNQNAS